MLFSDPFKTLKWYYNNIVLLYLYLSVVFRENGNRDIFALIQIDFKNTQRL